MQKSKAKVGSMNYKPDYCDCDDLKLLSTLPITGQKLYPAVCISCVEKNIVEDSITRVVLEQDEPFFIMEDENDVKHDINKIVFFINKRWIRKT